jgi:3-dehydrosphinganine reductase
MKMGYQFNNSIIIITGGSSGLGKALAQRLVTRGANIALIARNEKKLCLVKEELSALGKGGKRIEVFSCDVSDYDCVEQTFRKIVQTIGVPDILINNAGILREGRFENLSLSIFRETMDIDFFGVLHCIKAVLPLFRKKGSGRIVNISSLGGRMASYGYSAYCSSKFALVGLTDTLRAELKPHNINVHLVCPGEFDSPMVEELNIYRTEENRVVTQTVPVLPLDVVADEILRGIGKGRYLIVPGWMTRLLDLGYRLSPRFSRLIIDYQINRVSAEKDKS